MKKIKLCGISLCTLLAATGANAAGYTCEELIEYTSCMQGYYLDKDAVEVCPDGYHEMEAGDRVCVEEDGYINDAVDDYECEDRDDTNTWHSSGCLDESEEHYAPFQQVVNSQTCSICPAGYTCDGGTAQPAITPCEPGRYLSYCPEGYNYTSICLVDGEYYDEYEEYCVDDLGGKFLHVCEHVTEDEYVETRPMCNECPAGMICAGGVNVKPVACPAGSYCATAGLAAPTAQCAKGTYAGGGAISCLSCPTTGLKDINGNTVVATTVGTGATSVTACMVDSNAQLKDDKGIYHYKSNCEYGLGELAWNTPIKTRDECLMVEKITGVELSYMWADYCAYEGIDANPEDLERILSVMKLPQTKAECMAVYGYDEEDEDFFDYWQDGECVIECDDISFGSSGFHCSEL